MEPPIDHDADQLDHRDGQLSGESKQDWLRKKLTFLYDEHRRLDDAIAQMAKSGTIDYLQLQRFKKQKLGLKDKIQIIESDLLPDIIA